MEQSIPIELRVWDITLPQTALRGDPYMAIEKMPEHGRPLGTVHIRTLVQDFVEHHQRVIHVGTHEAFRWHFSTEGAFKGLRHPSFAVSDDGRVALDASWLDWFVAECDLAAKPYDLEYMVYINALTDDYHKFVRALPDRHAGKPKREGHWYNDHYIEEMLRLWKKHTEDRGWKDRFVVKIADEPTGFKFWYDRYCQAARAADVPIMTAFNSIDWKEAEEGLGHVRVWQPLYQNHNAEFFKKAKAAGARTEWYNCGPPPHIGIGVSAAELRSYMWQAAKAESTCWPAGASRTGRIPTTTGTSTYSHHNHVVYPSHPTKKPYLQQGKGWVDNLVIDGIRWELIREGFEDAAYVYLLREKIQAARQAGLAAAADAGDAVLAGICARRVPHAQRLQPAV